ncbi:MAG: MFS transporter [Nanoarchaeales archaeon]|nr:MFS transporter [Nanoarchaeales archaeon]
MLNKILLKNYLLDKSNDLILIKLFLSFGMAIISILPTLYLRHLGLSNSEIGLLMGGTLFLSILISMFTTAFLERINEYKIFVTSIIVPAICLVFILIFENLYFFIFYLILLSIFNTFKNNSFSIIFRDVTKKSEYSKKQGLMYALLNIGWFVGPLLAGLILENYSFFETFGLALMFITISIIISLAIKFDLKVKDRIIYDNNIIENFKYYIKRKKLNKAYLINFGSGIWYTLIFTFMPLYILDSGLGEAWVGIFISLTQLPLVLIQLKLGYFIEKFGTKNLMKYSYIYLIIVSILCFISPNVYTIMVLLMSTAVALGFIEPLRDIYFFKSVKSIDEEKTYPIFNTASPLGAVFGRLFLSYIVLLFAFEYIFLTMGILMLIFAGVCYTLKNYNN